MLRRLTFSKVIFIKVNLNVRWTITLTNFGDSKLSKGVIKSKPAQKQTKIQILLILVVICSDYLAPTAALTDPCIMYESRNWPADENGRHVFAGLPGPTLCFRSRKIRFCSHWSQLDLQFKSRGKMSTSGDELFKWMNWIGLNFCACLI